MPGLYFKAASTMLSIGILFRWRDATFEGAFVGQNSLCLNVDAATEATAEQIDAEYWKYKPENHADQEHVSWKRLWTVLQRVWNLTDGRNGFHKCINHYSHPLKTAQSPKGSQRPHSSQYAKNRKWRRCRRRNWFCSCFGVGHFRVVNWNHRNSDNEKVEAAPPVGEVLSYTISDNLHDHFDAKKYAEKYIGPVKHNLQGGSILTVEVNVLKNKRDWRHQNRKNEQSFINSVLDNLVAFAAESPEVRC